MDNENQECPNLGGGVHCFCSGDTCFFCGAPKFSQDQDSSEDDGSDENV